MTNTPIKKYCDQIKKEKHHIEFSNIPFLDLFKGYKISKNNIILQLFKFGLIGSCGMVIALLVINLIMISLHNFIIANIAGFIIAATSNFFLNRKFTFKLQNTYSTSKQWSMFIGTSLFGLVGNWSVTFSLYYLTVFFKRHYNAAVICGVFSGYLLNFFFSKFWIFEKQTKRKPKA